MNSLVFLILLTLISCSTSQGRQIASVTSELKWGEASREKSSVRLFPPDKKDNIISYYFFLELNDSQGAGVDSSPNDVMIKNKNKSLPYRMERINIGRYYLVVEGPKEIIPEHIDVFYKGKPLTEKFKLSTKVPDPKKSKITVISKDGLTVKLVLTLKDAEGKLIDIPSDPEVIFRGEASIDEIKHLSKGQWEFSVSYPDYNQIFYVSIRVHGTYLEDIFRFQHVEK